MFQVFGNHTDRVASRGGGPIPTFQINVTNIRVTIVRVLVGGGVMISWVVNRRRLGAGAVVLII